MSARGLAACFTALAAVTAGCRDAKQPAAPVAADVSLPLAAARAVEGDAVAVALAALPPRAGRCAQVRSLKEQAEAEAVAEALRQQLGLSVEVQRADLGERGVWWRLCVGDEDSDARMVARTASRNSSSEA